MCFDFQFLQVFCFNLGYDYKVNGWIISLDFMYFKDFNVMMVRNYGLCLLSGMLEGVDNCVIYIIDDCVMVFGVLINVYVFMNMDEGYLFNVLIQVCKNWVNGWFVSFGYNFLDVKDVSFIEVEIFLDVYECNFVIGNVNQVCLMFFLYGNCYCFVGSVYCCFEYGGNWVIIVVVFFEYV